MSPRAVYSRTEGALVPLKNGPPSPTLASRESKWLPEASGSTRGFDNNIHVIHNRYVDASRGSGCRSGSRRFVHGCKDEGPSHPDI
eukprot:1048790-Amorphochlora_amoeboformis.AAC.2